MSAKEKTYLLSDEAAMRSLGAKLAQSLQHKPALIFIFGDLGAGKTTLVQGFMKELVPQENFVQSPTYAYLQIYRGEILIYHFDLYRIEQPEAVYELGLQEFLDDASTIRLVEWPQRLNGLMIQPDIGIHISQFGAGRKVLIKYFSPFPVIP